jgi:hypothetical protein
MNFYFDEVISHINPEAKLAASYLVIVCEHCRYLGQFSERETEYNMKRT